MLVPTPARVYPNHMAAPPNFTRAGSTQNHKRSQSPTHAERNRKSITDSTPVGPSRKSTKKNNPNCSHKTLNFFRSTQAEPDFIKNRKTHIHSTPLGKIAHRMPPKRPLARHLSAKELTDPRRHPPQKPLKVARAQSGPKSEISVNKSELQMTLLKPEIFLRF